VEDVGDRETMDNRQSQCRGKCEEEKYAPRKRQRNGYWEMVIVI
jgi:hypothetical protein